jgi:hypothetical protein
VSRGQCDEKFSLSDKKGSLVAKSPPARCCTNIANAVYNSRSVLDFTTIRFTPRKRAASCISSS